MKHYPYEIEGKDTKTITLDKADLMVYLAGMFAAGFILALLAFNLWWTLSRTPLCSRVCYG